ncbi:unnamed protein product [Lymnaea stagnalis]|uniref:Uncharacterized protein n=1 Tax=Lymnaea stagnalis TaxID=6523 RepID=A0AAV2H9L3_LYMST
MAESLKGNLGLKSSPLAPTACKLSTQYLVLDHMTNHYNKIAKAKSAIDSKPPRSLTTSQKMRDRRNRELLISSPRPRQALSRSYSDLQRYQDIFNDEPEDEEERLVQSIMKTTLLDKPQGSNRATHGSASQQESHFNNSIMYKQAGDAHQGTRHSRPTSARSIHSARSIRSARSVQSGHSLTSMTSRVPISSHDPAKVTYQGDLLDKRPHLFTEPDKAFTPRTLKANHESKLKNSKWYNPPRVSRSASSNADDTKENAGRKPQPRTRKDKSDVSPDQDHQDDPQATAPLSESMLLDMTVRSRDGRHAQDGDHDVPRLAITMDQDHMNWLQDQASKAEVRQRSAGKLRSSLHSDDELHGRSSERRHSGLGDSVRLETAKNWFAVGSVTSQSSMATWISQRILEEDEEQKYLAFAREVTDDVRSRGICADSVLHRVFDNHIERKKHELDETRMRKVISDLKKDLGLSDLAYTPTTPSRKSSGRVNGSPAPSKVNGSVESSSTKDGSLSFPIIKDDMSTLEPLNVMSDMGTTLDSTSTIKFGQTGDMFSTINSLGEQEALEESNQQTDDSPLTATQALMQYQLSLTAEEANGDRSTSDATNSHTEPSHSSNGKQNHMGHPAKLARPATGERRTTADEDSASDASGVQRSGSSTVENLSRVKRRQRMQRTQDLDLSSSATSDQINSHSLSRHDTNNSDDTIIGHNGSLVNKSLKSSSHLEGSQDVNDDTDSVISSVSSQRPKAKPRLGRSQQPAIVESHQDVKVESHQDVKVDSHPGVKVDSHHGVTSDSSETDQVKQPDEDDGEIKEEYEDDYDDDYDADGDEGQGGSTHRTSDDDF